MFKKILPYIIVIAIALFIVFISFKASAQSFSDYKQYVIETDSITNKSFILIKDTSGRKIHVIISEDRGQDKKPKKSKLENKVAFINKKYECN